MSQSTGKSTADVRVARKAASLELPHRVGGWELLRLAAEGSLARIYRARPAESGAERPAAYAVKILHQRWQDDPRAVALFSREVLVGGAVSHPHLVPILAADVRQPPYFVVMPWLAGATLRDRLAAAMNFDLPVALGTIRQVAEALDALESAGWMHGDIKPSNIFMSPEGHVTLLDLGFARCREEIGSVVDRCLMGTCNYIAPEMITSALGADIRSDVYSLGVVLFEMLSGRLPFEGKDLAELVSQHRQTRPPDLRRLVPQLPTEVTRLVGQMLTKEPLRRPQTAGELIRRLVALEIATFGERCLG